MTSKRKWTEIDDSDEDEPLFGRQILPVADLPDDFNNTPMDGLQYLFTVRRDARQLPHVTRVENPYETIPSQPRDTLELGFSRLLPSAEWRTLFETRCKNLRLNMAQPTIHVQFASKSDAARLMPDKKDRDLWWAFLAGKPESEWNPPKQPKQPKQSKWQSSMRGFADDPYQYEDGPPSDGVNLYGDEQAESAAGETQLLPTPFSTPRPLDTPEKLESSSNPGANFSQPREPSMSLLRHINERAALHLLMYFAHWINIYVSGDISFQPMEAHARWIFFLLSRVDEYISPDEINALRNLARAGIKLLKSLIQQRLAKDNTDIGTEPASDSMGERSCWIIICTIVGIWGQRDLLMDAEEALKELS